MTLLDPLSDQRHSLPDRFPRMSKLHYFNTVDDIVNGLYLEKAVVKYLDSNAGSYRFVLLTIHLSGKLAVLRSCDRAWSVINDMPSPYDDVIVFDGRFFLCC